MPVPTSSKLRAPSCLASAPAISLRWLGDSRLEPIEARYPKRPHLLTLQRHELGASRNERLDLALQLVDEAAQISQATAFRSRIGDVEERGSGVHLGAHGGRRQRPDLSPARRVIRRALITASVLVVSSSAHGCS